MRLSSNQERPLHGTPTKNFLRQNIKLQIHPEYPKHNTEVRMRLSSILFIVTTASSQSPFANTLDVSRAIRQFTTSFLNDLELSTSTNFVFSPFSIHSVFTQLLFGAQGDTRSQLTQVLGLTDSEGVRAQYSSLAANIRSGSAQLL